MSSPSGQAGAALGASGPFARLLPGFEARAGQLEMARAVERTLELGGALICEAGTGTGKTLGYLVPAVQSGQRIVISTATRNLQEQIFRRDLPLVARALGVPAEAALLKGLGNYVCRRRYAEWQRSGGRLSVLEDFVQHGESGDVGELELLPEADAALGAVVSGSETRIGPSCEFYELCFVTRAKRLAEQARIVVVNHHLFFADLALRGPHPGRVLPDYEAVIFDEAHEIEDVATQFFGLRVSRAGIERLAGDLERRLLHAPGDQGRARSALAELRAAAAGFWHELGRYAAGGEPRTAFQRELLDRGLESAWYRVDTALERAAPADDENDAARQLSARAERIRGALSEIVEGSAGSVSWLEGTPEVSALSASPVDVAPILKQRLFDAVPSVVLTSATLAAGAAGDAASRFGYLRTRLGVDELEASELVVDSGFDYAARALLYLPRDLPLPDEPGFLDAVAERSAELIEISGGGAFVLATSLRSMRALSRRLSALLPRTSVLTQGDLPKSALVDGFRELGDAVLVATHSFWQGVDVPGWALRLVILEKIPFAAPGDPIVRARALALEQEGRSPFGELVLPGAALTLKQGFGRLIRSAEDVGIVALLDGRVHRRGYGKRLLAGLPAARREHELDGVRRFWQAARRLAGKSAD